MTFTPEDFDTHFNKWKEWPTTPWNRLLYSTLHCNLQRHLGTPPLHILDVGGGNGEDALFLARLGHTVALVDFSAEMLTDARKCAAEIGVADKISLHQADVAELVGLFADSHFDVILCHNMIKFVDDSFALLRDLCDMLKQDGWLSITAINPYSEVYRQATFLNDLSAAQEAIGQRNARHPWFDKVETRHAPENLIQFLESLGCTLLGHYGLRCIVDYLTDNEAKFDPEYFSELEKLEHALTDQYPYYLLARMFQIVVRKG